MKQHWTNPLEKLVKNPKVQFTVGSLLLFISITEIFFQIQPHHCVALIGIQHMVWALPNILQGAERVVKGLK